MTSLPGENTLLSLPPGPVLELICVAAQRQVTAVWLSLAQMLTQQLNPPTYSTIRSLPHDSAAKDAQDVAAKAATILIETSLRLLAAQGAMDTVRLVGLSSLSTGLTDNPSNQNPDIVRALFTYMMTVSQITHAPAADAKLIQGLAGCDHFSCQFPKPPPASFG